MPSLIDLPVELLQMIFSELARPEQPRSSQTPAFKIPLANRSLLAGISRYHRKLQAVIKPLLFKHVHIDEASVANLVNLLRQLDSQPDLTASVTTICVHWYQTKGLHDQSTIDRMRQSDFDFLDGLKKRFRLQVGQLRRDHVVCFVLLLTRSVQVVEMFGKSNVFETLPWGTHCKQQVYHPSTLRFDRLKCFRFIVNQSSLEPLLTNEADATEIRYGRYLVSLGTNEQAYTDRKYFDNIRPLLSLARNMNDLTISGCHDLERGFTDWSRVTRLTLDCVVPRRRLDDDRHVNDMRLSYLDELLQTCQDLEHLVIVDKEDTNTGLTLQTPGILRNQHKTLRSLKLGYLHVRSGRRVHRIARGFVVGKLKSLETLEWISVPCPENLCELPRSLRILHLVGGEEIHISEFRTFALKLFSGEFPQLQEVLLEDHVCTHDPSEAYVLGRPGDDGHENLGGRKMTTLKNSPAYQDVGPGCCKKEFHREIQRIIGETGVWCGHANDQLQVCEKRHTVGISDILS